jgi:S-adenosylmethionine hydrolase
VSSYAEHQSGDLVALVDSENYIEIAIVNGSAAYNLGAHVGDLVEVILGK